MKQTTANAHFSVRFTRIFAVFVIFCVIFASFSPAAFAETPEERYERLKEELTEISAELSDAKANLASEKNQQAALAQQKAVVDEMIALNQDKIDETRDMLAEKEKDAAKVRESLEKNDELFRQRLVAMYKMNNSSILSQLLSVDSFAEFLQAVDALRRVSQNDTALLNTLKEEREKLEKEQAEIDEILDSLWESYDELEDNAAVLQGNIREQDASVTEAEAALAAQNTAYAGTSEELAAAQAEMAALAAEAAATGSQKGDNVQPAPAPESSSAAVPAPEEGGETAEDGGEDGEESESAAEPAPEPEPTPEPEPAPTGKFIWPVPGFYNVSCYFGAPDPNGVAHRGMDISRGGAATIEGAPIVACQSGTVIIAKSAPSYGNYIVVDHGNGLKTLYAHCSSLAAGVGAAVSAGQTIAYVGHTGFVTGPHLHLEVIDGGVLQNPSNYF